MKRSKFSEAQIAVILRKAEEGTPVATFAGRRGSARRCSISMHGSLGASDSSKFLADLAANIYPASPGMLARPNG